MTSRGQRIVGDDVEDAVTTVAQSVEDPHVAPISMCHNGDTSKLTTPGVTTTGVTTPGLTTPGVTTTGVTTPGVTTPGVTTSVSLG